MLDQLHRFASAYEAENAFPRPLDDDGQQINAPCWMAGTATVMPVTVFVMDNGAVRPSVEVWYGVSVPDEDANMFWDMASAAVELRPPGGSAFWTDQVTRARIDAATASAVMGVSPTFAGRGYTFPEWPAADA